MDLIADETGRKSESGTQGYNARVRLSCNEKEVSKVKRSKSLFHEPGVGIVTDGQEGDRGHRVLRSDSP